MLPLVAGHGIEIKSKECEFTKELVELLEHFVEKYGVCIDSEKVEGVLDTAVPTSQTKVRSFLDTAKYYR